MSIVIEYSKGDKVGELTYISPAESIGKKKRAVFLCKCGVEFVTRVDRAKAVQVKSCGCSSNKLRSDKLKEHYQVEYRAKTHGLTKHPLYRVWRNAINRCCNPKFTCYDRYGGRGVTICDEWKESFTAFYSWAIANGYQEGLELDKDMLGNGLLYSPQTCCWLTPKENSRHRRNNRFCLLNGKKMIDKDASLALGYNSTYVGKIRKGSIPNKHPNLVLLDRERISGC